MWYLHCTFVHADKQMYMSAWLSQHATMKMGNQLKHCLMKSTSHGGGVYVLDPVYQLTMDATFWLSYRVYETSTSITAAGQ